MAYFYRYDIKRNECIKGGNMFYPKFLEVNDVIGVTAPSDGVVEEIDLFTSIFNNELELKKSFILKQKQRMVNIKIIFLEMN